MRKNRDPFGVSQETSQIIKMSSEEDKRNKIFFVCLEDARILKSEGFERIVVLVDSFEYASVALSEGFILALKEYFWTNAKTKKRFRGFQFFVSSLEEANSIKHVISSHAKIVEGNPSRVTCRMLPENVSLRWLAERFILQH